MKEYRKMIQSLSMQDRDLLVSAQRRAMARHKAFLEAMSTRRAIDLTTTGAHDICASNTTSAMNMGVSAKEAPVRRAYM